MQRLDGRKPWCSTVSDSRERLLNLLTGSSAYATGVAVERDRLRCFIRARIEELNGLPSTRQRQSELQNLLRLLDDAPDPA